MNTKNYLRCRISGGILSLGFAAVLFAPAAYSQTASTWDGSELDGLWSNALNWDVAPAVDEYTLVFADPAGGTVTNDAGTVTGLYSATAFTFAVGAGSFVLDGDPITFSRDASGDIIDNLSGVDQTLNMDFSTAGGGARTRNISPNGATITLNGDNNWGNDTWFPNGTAGTIVLNGNNSGVGGGLIGDPARNARRIARNNVSGTHIVFGSPTAIGDPNGTGGNEDIVLQQVSGSVFLSASTDLTGANRLNNSLFNNGNSGGVRIRFEGTENMEFGGLLNGGNQGHGYILQGTAADVEIGGNIYLSTNTNPSRATFTVNAGAGDLTLSGVIVDTYDIGDVVTPGTFSESILRMEGDGLMIVSGDNLYNGLTQIGNGTVRMGHVNAFGPDTRSSSVDTVVDAVVGDPLLFLADTSGLSLGMTAISTGIPAGAVITVIDPNVSVTVDMAPTVTDTMLAVTFDGGAAINGILLESGGTLDLNGLTISKTFSGLSGNGEGDVGAIINSNIGTPAELTTDIFDIGLFSVGGAGDLILPNVLEPAGVQRGITKVGTGTLTLGGDLSNNRHGLTVDEGNVILAKTDGDAVGRFPLIMNNASSVVTLTNSSDQIVDIQIQEINLGTLDLNGFDESFWGVGMTAASVEAGGTITNSNGVDPSTLTLGIGTPSGDPTWPGTISGNLSLVKGAANIQTLTGTLAYTGNTSVNAGTLSITADTLADGSTVSIAVGAVLDLNHAATDDVNALFIDGVQVAAGTYGSSGSAAANQDDVHFLVTGAGVLNVLTGPVASDYDDWALGFSLVGGMDDDDDNDGKTNKEEYSFGLNPTSGASVSEFTGQVDTAAGTFSYTRRNTGLSSLTYRYWHSTTLQGAFTEFTPTLVDGDAGDPVETVEITVPGALLGANPTLFFQVTAE